MSTVKAFGAAAATVAVILSLQGCEEQKSQPQISGPASGPAAILELPPQNRTEEKMQALSEDLQAQARTGTLTLSHLSAVFARVPINADEPYVGEPMFTQRVRLALNILHAYTANDSFPPPRVALFLAEATAKETQGAYNEAHMHLFYRAARLGQKEFFQDLRGPKGEKFVVSQETRDYHAIEIDALIYADSAETARAVLDSIAITPETKFAAALRAPSHVLGELLREPEFSSRESIARLAEERIELSQWDALRHRVADGVNPQDNFGQAQDRKDMALILSRLQPGPSWRDATFIKSVEANKPGYAAAFLAAGPSTSAREKARAAALQWTGGNFPTGRDKALHESLLHVLAQRDPLESSPSPQH
jgi:hypothetical protein